MVAYLILMFGLIIVTSGIAFMFTNDVLDSILAATSYVPLANQMDADSIQTGFLLLILFKNILIVVLLCLIFWCWTMAQKPNRSW